MAEKIIVRELITKLGYSADDRGLKEAESMLGNFQKKASIGLRKIADFGVKATIGVGAVFAAMTAGSIMAASSLESMQGQFEVMLGSVEKADQLVKDLQETGATTPFQTKDLAKGAQTLLAFGQSAESILPTIRNLGDIAGNDTQRFQSLTLAFAQMSSAGRLMGQDLLQMINAGFNPLQVISEKTGKSMLQLKKEMEKGAISSDMVAEAFRSATAEGGRFYKNMEKQSTLTRGLFSTLRDNIALVAIEWGKVFLPAIKAATAAAIKLFQGPIMDGVKMIAEKLLPDVSSLGDSFADWINNAEPLIDGFFQTIADGIDWIKAFKDSASFDNMVTQWKAILAAVQSLAPVGTLLMNVFSFLFEVWKGFLPVTTNIYRLIESLGDLIGTLLGPAISFWGTMAEGEDTIQLIGGLINQWLINPLIETIKWIDWVFQAFGTLATGLQTWFSSFFNWLQASWEMVLSWFSSETPGIFSRIWTAITTSFQRLFSNAIIGVQRVFGDFFDWAFTIISKIGEIIAGIFILPRDAFLEIINMVGPALSNLFTIISNLPIVKAFIAPFQKAFDFIRDKVQALMGWLTKIPGLDIKLPSFPDLNMLVNKPKEDIAKTIEKNAKIQNNKINQIFNTKVDGAGMDAGSLAGDIATKTGDAVRAAFSIQLQEVLTVARGV